MDGILNLCSEKPGSVRANRNAPGERHTVGQRAYDGGSNYGTTRSGIKGMGIFGRRFER